jgi:hypothetical protein
MQLRGPLLTVPILAATALLLAGCGGGKAANAVASLNGSSATTVKKGTSGTDEQQLLTWVQCMRKNGVNLPDPTVDANGNLTLRGPGGGPDGPRGGDGQTAQSGQGGASTTDAPRPDRAAFDKARQACGTPPQGAFGGFNRSNDPAFQDAALKFAQCMRDHGVDVPDPNFNSTNGPPAGGPFGSLDRNDPKVSAAFDACRSILPNRRGGSTTTTAATNS